jgi:hypothetical protein
MAIKDVRKKKLKRRGAALVEAALVLPTLAIFLGMTMYEYRSYREKMLAQQTTRLNAFYFASHGCEGQGASGGFLGSIANGSVGNTGGFGPAGYSYDTSGSGGADKVLNNNPPGDGAMQAKTDRSFNQATSQVTRHATGGGFSRDLTGNSKVFCNERPEDGDPIGVAKWAFNFFRTGLI